MHVDERAAALGIAQLQLHRLQLIAMRDADPGSGLAEAAIEVRLIGDQRNAFEALGAQLLHDLLNRELSIDGLTPGHGDGVVIENLVGDVDAGGHGCSNRQQAGVEIGAVAKVLEHVFRFGKRRLAEPGRPFTAHLGKGFGAAVHPSRHVMAADTAVGHAAFGHDGGRVVRTARAKPGFALGALALARQCRLLVFEKLEALVNGRAVEEARNARGDHASDHRRRQFAQVGQQQVALFVVLADHARAFVDRPVVKLPGQLVFDHAALFLDHEDFVKAVGETMRHDRFQRPAHADLEHANPDLRRQRFVDTEVLERLQGIEIGFAGGDDPKPRVFAVDGNAIDVVGAGKGARGVDLVPLQPLFLRHRRIRPARVHAVFRQLVIVRYPHLHPRRIDFGGDGRVHVFGNGLEADPAAAVARQFPAEHTEIEHFLHVGRVQHRYRRADEHVVALVRQGRGFAGVVVTDHGEHAAVAGGAKGVRVFQHVHAAVEARALAVPHAEHTVVARAGKQVDLLAAPDRRHREVFVDARSEEDIVFFGESARAPERLVETANG